MDQSPLDIGRIHIIVTGRVQGVGFRAFVQHTAEELGLSGWVRNIGFNRVEAIAEGSLQGLKEFQEIVIIGPRSARVNESDIKWEIPIEDLTSFVIK